MVRLKNILISLIISAFILVTGCDSFANDIFKGDGDKSFRCSNVPIVNKTDGNFDIKGTKLKIYNINDSDVPYVDILDFLLSLDGFFDCENITYSFKKSKNELYLQRENKYKVVINWYKNTISSNNYVYFSYYSNNSISTDYSRFLYYQNEYYSVPNAFSIDVSNYYFDIYYCVNSCLVPLFFANLLFCSSSYLNVFYNVDKCYVTYGETYELDGYYTNSVNKKPESKEMRIAAVNSLLFTFDYFYGLKEYKGYTKAFKNYISDENLDLLWSNDSLDNYNAYKQFIYKMLDELHTRIDLPSYYCDTDQTILYNDDYGEFRNEYYARSRYLSSLRTIETNGYRINDDVAIITFDSFLTGTNSEIYNNDGSLKNDAWKYDTYYLFQKLLREIKTHTEVKKIVIDLSLNGGGNIGAMLRVLGFISDKKINYSTHDTLNNSYCIDSFLVDTDGDGNYANDAYSNYDWYLLTGINTFSAANTFTSIFKEMKLGKTIGQQSGGGMCTVLPLVLADGTGITISSPNTIRYVREENGKKVFYSIENGIKPNIIIDYEHFYDDVYIKEIIDNQN